MVRLRHWRRSHVIIRPVGEAGLNAINGKVVGTGSTGTNLQRLAGRKEKVCEIRSGVAKGFRRSLDWCNRQGVARLWPKRNKKSLATQLDVSRGAIALIMDVDRLPAGCLLAPV